VGGGHCHDAKSICSTKEFFLLSPPPQVLELDGLMLRSLFLRSKFVMGNSLRSKKHTSADLSFYFTILSFVWAP
jgi:hypothetical protein